MTSQVPPDLKPSDSPAKLSYTAVFAAGGVSGMISRTLTAPLDRIKIMLQAGAPKGTRETGSNPNEWCGCTFSTEVSTLEDAICSHACSLEESMRVTNGSPLGYPPLLTVTPVNYVTTLKAIRTRTASGEKYLRRIRHQRLLEREWRQRVESDARISH
jgi:hypothetical protein